MKLSEEIKNKIAEEYETWFNNQYGNSTQEERKELGAFYTPAEITIQMIEKLDTLDGKILDRCCGSGNLLAGCIIAGANPNNVYGNEYDERFVKLAQQRLNKFGVPEYHIHQGNALNPKALSNFSKNYKPVMNEPKKKTEAEKKAERMWSKLGIDIPDDDDYEQINLY